MRDADAKRHEEVKEAGARRMQNILDILGLDVGKTGANRHLNANSLRSGAL